MKKAVTLLLCTALILSLGCSRNLDDTPASSAAPVTSAAAEETNGKSPEQSKPAEEKPVEASSVPAESKPGQGDVPSAAQQPEAAESESPAVSDKKETDPPAFLSAKADVTTERDWRLILVNPDNLIPEGWVPELTMTKYGYQVDSRIVDDVTALIEGAAKDNVSLLICYGYRTLEQSQQLFEKQIRRQLANGLSQEAAVAEAKRWVAPPGTSDHHTGLALDIVTPEYQVLNHGFYDTPAGRWMAEHCWEYGFVIRFPKDKQEITGITYEPWHLRFVGKEHAAAMHEQNLCLEEYFELLYGK